MPSHHNSVHISRLHSLYRIARHHPSPAKLRDHLDQASARLLPEALGRCSATWMDGADRSVCFIRRLKFSLVSNAKWDPSQLAQSWGRRLSHAIAQALQDDSDRANVIRFEDPETYRSRFLLDLVGGTAWGKWYYHRFRGLRPLPVSSAIRTLLCGTGGLATLLCMSAPQRDVVIRALSEGDAGRILESVSKTGPSQDRPQLLKTVLNSTLGLESKSWHDSETRLALRLWLNSVAREPSLAGPDSRLLVLGLARLVTFLQRASTQEKQALKDLLLQNSSKSLYRLLGPANAAILEPLLGISEAQFQWLEEHPGRTNLGKKRSTSQAEWQTPFGGAFLLLPFLNELPLLEACRPFPGLGKTSAPGWLRLLLLAKCVGNDTPFQVLADPLLRRVTDVPGDLNRVEVRQWLAEAAKSSRVEAFRTALSSLQPNPADNHCMLVRSERKGRPVALLLEGTSGTWLWALDFRAGKGSQLVAPLRQVLKEQGSPRLILEQSLAPVLLPQLEDLEPTVLGHESSDPEASDHRAFLARTERICADLSFLDSSADLDCPDSLNLAISVAAQQILRRFSSRLPGFAQSSLQHLLRNFLQFPATLEDQAERRVVLLGKPPLDLVLRMTGMTRQTYRLEWLDDKPFELFPRD